MIKKFLTNLFQDHNGATAIEYALIAAMVVMASVGALSSIGAGLNTTSETISTSLNN